MNDANELLKQFLTERDVPCPVCKYNLRGLTASKCPECGGEVTLQLQSRRVPWPML